LDSGLSLHFGAEAEKYFAFRPQYPAALFAWLAQIAPARGLAWDCGTGSGQAALGLSEHFAHVLATDPDPRQLALAPKRANIDYRLAPAEAGPGPREAVDLIACACSIHWFDLPKFYETASRALKPGGVIAAWTYDWPWTGSAPLDAVLERLKSEILGPFWGDNAALYFNRYEELPFPFEGIETPAFHVAVARSPADFLAFLATWSAIGKYRQSRGCDPLQLVEKELAQAWRAAPPPLPLRVPLHMRCGHKALAKLS
jgi:SAM-dependent methyltransferase